MEGRECDGPLLRHKLIGVAADPDVSPRDRSLVRCSRAAVLTTLAAMSTARGTFNIVMTPGTAEMEGAVSRFDFTKTFLGDLEATGMGVMLSCGNPQVGEAGYVAIETVRGRIGEREGGFALQQVGRMHRGSQTLHYEVVPGSGRGAFVGIVGTFHLTIEEDGTHRYELAYEL